MLSSWIDKGATFKHINAISGGVISGYLIQSGNGDKLREFWTEALPAHANSLKWYAGIPLNVLTRQRGLISPNFSKKLINDWITEQPEGLSFDVVSMFDGEQHTLTHGSFNSIEGYKSGIYAAVAIPGAFEPVDLFTTSGPILDSADGGLYYPLPRAVSDLSISTHHYDREIQRVKGPLSALLRVWYWRQWRVLGELFNQDDVILPEVILPKSWDWKKDSLTYSFEHGRRVGDKTFDGIFS